MFEKRKIIIQTLNNKNEAIDIQTQNITSVDIGDFIEFILIILIFIKMYFWGV